MSIKTETIKIVLVDDDYLFRKILRDHLNRSQNYTIVGEAQNGKEYIELLKTTKPDVVLMDVNMPFVDGFEAAGFTKKFYETDIHVIIISSYKPKDFLTRTVAAGGSGILFKTSILKDIDHAIETVLSKQFYINPNDVN